MLQAEDEIAGIGAVVGASFAGQEGDDRDLGPGHVAEDRDARPRHDRRAAAGLRQRAARRALDRHPDQERAVGPVPGGASRRTATSLRPVLAPIERRRHVRDHGRGLQHRRAVPDAGHHPVRPGDRAAQGDGRPDRHDARSRSSSGGGRPSASSSTTCASGSPSRASARSATPGWRAATTWRRASSTTSAARRRRAARCTRDEREAAPQARRRSRRARDLFLIEGDPRRAARARQLGQRRGRRARGARRWRARRGHRGSSCWCRRLLYPVAEEVYRDFFALGEARPGGRAVAPGPALPHPPDVRGRAPRPRVVRPERLEPDPARRRSWSGCASWCARCRGAALVSRSRAGRIREQKP